MSSKPVAPSVTCAHCRRTFPWSTIPADHLWSALVTWTPDDREVVDVCVPNRDMALAAVEAELRANYLPGWTIARVERRNQISADALHLAA